MYEYVLDRIVLPIVLKIAKMTGVYKKEKIHSDFLIVGCVNATYRNVYTGQYLWLHDRTDYLNKGYSLVTAVKPSGRSLSERRFILPRNVAMDLGLISAAKHNEESNIRAVLLPKRITFETTGLSFHRLKPFAPSVQVTKIFPVVTGYELGEASASEIDAINKRLQRINGRLQSTRDQSAAVKALKP